MADELDPIDARILDILQQDAGLSVAEVADRVGLSARLGHYPKLLSGGEQQRVALARAFVMRPALLLADEPTGSLDFATGETVMQLMLDLNREQGTTLMLVTHDPAIAARCGRRLAIEAGCLLPEGNAADPLHRPLPLPPA